MTAKSTDHKLQLHFASIFKRHEYKLYTLALQLTKSDQYAKDIVQDVFLKLWQRRNNVAVINNPEGLLYKLTENHIIEFLSKAASDKRLRDALWVNMQYNIEPEEYTSSCREYDHLKEYNQLIGKAIDQLPPQRQRIYQLRNEDGFHYTHLMQKIEKHGFRLRRRAAEGKHLVKDKFSGFVKYLQGFFK
ncbi:MAG: sigma-70 family RNA polymerase sigma factor [Chitinophagaceae bacterium]|nr:sigma-70 family RNA polymerase sigma factor [Chitinophagaceae bacterium]